VYIYTCSRNGDKVGDRAFEKLRPTAYKRFKTFETVYDCKRWFSFPREVSEMGELMKISGTRSTERENFHRHKVYIIILRR
jgi:hypothetical protein